MNKKIMEKLTSIFGIAYYFFSLIASGIVLIQIFNHYNLKNGFINLLVYVFCFGGSLAMMYTTLQDIDRFDKK